MKQLIYHEFKKVFKNKLFILFIVALVGWTGFEAYKSYTPDVRDEYGAGYWDYYNSDLVYQDENGKDLDGLDYLVAADELLHSYAGKVDKASLDKFYQDYKDKVANLKVDETATTKYFGNDGWKILYEKSLNGTLSESEVNEYCESIQKNCNYDTTFENGEMKYFLYPIIYEKMGYKQFLTRVYYNDISFSGNSIENQSMTYMNILVNKKEYVEKYWNYYYSRDNKKDVYQKFLKERYLNADTEFDSVIPNNTLLNNMNLINFFTLLLIAMICANIFSLESHNKTDQILVPTKLGSVKLAIAKLVVGISISLGIVLLQLIVVYSLAFVLLPVHKWNLFIYDQAGTWGGGTLAGCIYSEVFVKQTLAVIIASLAIGIFTMFISYVSKNRFASIIISFLFIMVPLFILQGKTGILAIVERMMPTFIMDYRSFLNIGESSVISTGNGFIEWIYVVILIWVVFMIVMSVYILIDSKRHIVKNK